MTELAIGTSFPMPSNTVLLQPMDPTNQSYGGSRVLFREAATQFGVNLEEQEFEDWRSLLGGAYLADHLLDIEKTDLVAHLLSIINGDFFDGLHIDSQIRFRNYMVSRTPEQYADIMHQIAQVPALIERQRQAETPKEVIDVRLEEGDILADLLALPVEDREDAASRHRFNSWVNGWSRAGYLIDSLVDVRSDFENDESGLEPTIRARAAIGKAALHESVIAARKTPPALFGKCILVATKYVFLGKKPDITREG